MMKTLFGSPTSKLLAEVVTLFVPLLTVDMSLAVVWYDRDAPRSMSVNSALQTHVDAIQFARVSSG